MEDIPVPVKIPLLNPNEPEAVLAAILVHEGQQVAAGDVLCTLETTKSAADLAAERDGYVAGLRFAQGQTVRAGDTFCFLAGAEDWTPPQETPPGAENAGQAKIPAGLRITQPALSLARQRGLDLAQLPLGPLITEGAVRAALEKQPGGPELTPPAGDFDPTALIIYGGGGHGKMLIDLVRALHAYRIAGVIDDGLSPGAKVLGVPVLGGGEALPELYAQGVRLALNAVGGIGNVAVRIQVFRRLAEAGFAFPAVVHPSAVVEGGAELAPGAQVLARAYVGSEARIGFGCILNTGSIVSHDCVLGNYATISPGALLAGEVQIGSGALVGMGVTVNLGVKIGERARLGNGATVKADVPPGGLVRAGRVWPD
ncbi:MAG TPA: NeuD/PglB/VioB family sugar acetyltransferase [Anaerolineales bacterium]